MQTHDMTTTKTPAQFQEAITKTAGQIASGQARVREVLAALATAEGRRDQIGGVLQLARAQHVASAELDGYQTQYDAASGKVEALRDERQQLETKLYDLHATLNTTWQQRRIREALGGRSLAVAAVPDWRTDPRLDTLIHQAADVAAKTKTTAAALTAASDRLATAEERAKTTRIGVHRKTATRADLTVAENEATAAAGAHVTLEQEHETLRDVAETIARERQAFEQALYTERVPAFQAAYRAGLVVFIEKLREAAIANEAVWALFEALNSSDATPQLQPWRELRVLVDDSKFRGYLAEAREAGLVDD